MINLKEYEQLREQIASLQRQQAKAEGALEGLLARLTTEHGCRTIGEAQRHEERLQREATQAEQAYQEALVAFREQWGPTLEGIEK